MNRIVLLCLLTVFQLEPLSAQQFGANNPIWNFGVQSFWGGYTYPSTLTVEKDTIFEQKACIILKSSFWPKTSKARSYSSLLPFKRMFCTDSTKVYYWSVDKSEFQLLYNFDAVAGDKWGAWLEYSPDSAKNDSLLIEVDSVFKINTNGDELRAQKITYSSANNRFYVIHESRTIIEGIGDTYSLLPLDGRGLDGDYVDELRCFEDDSVGFYQFDKSVDCDYTNVGIKKELNTETFHVFPNPSQGVFQLKGLNSEPDYVYTVSTGQGQLIKSGSVTENAVNLKQLPSGVYYLKLYEEGGQVATQKLIIHE